MPAARPCCFIKIASINQRGENIMPGNGVIALPQKGKPLPAFPLDHMADKP